MGSAYLECLVDGCHGYLDLLYEDDGVSVYRCRHCGATVTVNISGERPD